MNSVTKKTEEKWEGESLNVQEKNHSLEIYRSVSCPIVAVITIILLSRN
jgi:hypothetical protein